MYRKYFLMAILAVPVGIAPAIAAEQTQAVISQRLAAGCANCHGATGVSVGDTIPSLAGQPQQDLLTSLTDYKSGKRAATVMHQIAKGYSDEQLASLAAYFAAQKK